MEPTEAQKKWWRRFRSCIKAMPNDMEVIVGNVGVSATKRGEILKELNNKGDIDTLEYIELPIIITQDVIPCGEE